MADETFLFKSASGVTHSMIEDADGIRFRASQDVDAILERNKAMATHNDGYTPSREMRRVASLPMGVVYEWLINEGWNALDPEHADKLAAKLNSAEWAHLRTAPGRLGVSNGVMR
jgi:hypothetical protein